MASKKNLIQEISYSFALRIVGVCKEMVLEHREFHLSRQLLKSGTSIGANVEESVGGQSRADFVSKLSIAYKESRETVYWIRILKDSGYLNPSDEEELLVEAERIRNILHRIIKTTKHNS